METQIAFAFNSAQVANRFLNALKSSNINQTHLLKAKLFKGSEKVLVSYAYDVKGFDHTASQLDDLASRYDGHEISIG